MSTSSSTEEEAAIPCFEASCNRSSFNARDQNLSEGVRQVYSEVLWTMVLLCAGGIVVNGLGLYVIFLSFLVKEAARWLMVVGICDLVLCVWIIPFEIYGLAHIGTVNLGYGACILLTTTDSWVTCLVVLTTFTAAVYILGRCLLQRFPQVNKRNWSIVLGINILLALALGLGTLMARSTGLLFYSTSANPSKSPEDRSTCTLREATFLESDTKAAEVVIGIRLAVLLALFLCTCAASVVVLYMQKRQNGVVVDKGLACRQSVVAGSSEPCCSKPPIDKIRLMKAVDNVVDSAVKVSRGQDTDLKQQIKDILTADMKLIDRVVGLYFSDERLSFIGSPHDSLETKLSSVPLLERKVTSPPAVRAQSPPQTRSGRSPGDFQHKTSKQSVISPLSQKMPAVSEFRFPPRVPPNTSQVSFGKLTTPDVTTLKQTSAVAVPRYKLSPSDTQIRSSPSVSGVRRSLLSFTQGKAPGNWGDSAGSSRGMRSQERRQTSTGCSPSPCIGGRASQPARPPQTTTRTTSAFCPLCQTSMKTDIRSRSGASVWKANVKQPPGFHAPGNMAVVRRASSLPDVSSDVYFRGVSSTEVNVQAALAYVHAPDSCQTSLRKEMVYQRALNSLLIFGYCLKRTTPNMCGRRVSDTNLVFNPPESIEYTVSHMKLPGHGETSKPTVEGSIMMMLLLAVLLLIVSLIPLCFAKIVNRNYRSVVDPSEALENYIWTEWYYLHAVLKPLVYFLLVPKFRARFLFLLCRCCLKSRTPDPGPCQRCQT